MASISSSFPNSSTHRGLAAFKCAARAAGHVYTVVYGSAEHAWSYVGKISSLTRNLINAAAKSTKITALTGGKIAKHAPTITNSLRLLSIISMPFTLVSIKNTTMGIFNHLRNRDAEGLVLGSLSLTMLATDAFDSVTTFVNAALSLASLPTVGLFSTIAIPVGLLGSGIGSILRLVSLGKGVHLHEQIRKNIISQSDPEAAAAALKEFLDERLSVSPEEKERILTKCGGNQKKADKRINRLLKRKKAALLRSASSGAAKEMQKLYTLLNEEGALEAKDLEEVIKDLNKIQGSLRKKVILDVVGLVANILTISALIMFLTGFINPLPYILLVIAVCIRILMLLAQEIDFSALAEKVQKWRAQRAHA